MPVVIPLSEDEREALIGEMVERAEILVREIDAHEKDICLAVTAQNAQAWAEARGEVAYRRARHNGILWAINTLSARDTPLTTTKIKLCCASVSPDFEVAKSLKARCKEAERAAAHVDRERGNVDRAADSTGGGELLAGIALKVRGEAFGPAGRD